MMRNVHVYVHISNEVCLNVHVHIGDEGTCTLKCTCNEVCFKCRYTYW